MYYQHQHQYGDYSSVFVPATTADATAADAGPGPWDTIPSTAAPLGGPLYPDAQAPIRIRTLPNVRLFTERQRVMTEVASAAIRQFKADTAARTVAHGSSITWMAPIVGYSYRISAGDFLFTDDALCQPPPGRTNSSSSGGECLDVFASFAGHSAALPPGYVMALDTFSEADPVTGVPVKDLRPRALVRILGDGTGLEIKDPGEEQRVMQEAWRLRNRYIRFAGVASTSYTVGSVGGLEGVAAQVSGSVVVINSTGRTLMFRDLVTLALPGEHIPIPLYPRPFEVLADPRAVLRLYRRSDSFTVAIRSSLKALLVPPTQDGGSHLLEPVPHQPGLAPAATARNKHYLEPTAAVAMEDVPKENRAALALIAYAEAAVLWGDAVRRTIPDLAGPITSPTLTGGRLVNPLRLGIAAALGFHPADVDLVGLGAAWGVTPPDVETRITEAIMEGIEAGITGSGNPEQVAFVRMRSAAQVMLRILSTLDAHAGIAPPFGQVMEGGEPGGLVSIKLL